MFPPALINKIKQSLAEHTINIEDIEVSTNVIDDITPLHVDYTSFIKTALNNNEYDGTFVQIEV